MCKSSNGSTCVTTGNWEQGWFLYVDESDDGVKDEGEEIIQVYDALQSGFLLRSGGALNLITYRSSGAISDADTFTLFPPCTSGDSLEANQIVISATGRPRRAETTQTCP